jgi:hypothetical protein
LTNPNKEQSNPPEANMSLPPMIRSKAPDLKRPHGKHMGIPTVSNGQMTNLHLNDNNYRLRQGSFDANQRITYRKVMNRVIKRFLLHKQREEQEEIREGDFEELKQDIQMLRFEMLNRLDETRDDLSKNSHLLNEGVLIVGELLSSLVHDTNPLIKENFHLFKKSFYSRTDSGIESTTSTLSTTSTPNIIQLISNSHSTSHFSFDHQQESDINPINAFKQLGVTCVGLTQIVEEVEMEPLPYTDDEEEIPARHMSIQTCMDNTDEIFSKF